MFHARGRPSGRADPPGLPRPGAGPCPRPQRASRANTACPRETFPAPPRLPPAMPPKTEGLRNARAALP